jgi:hypothetical protein
VVALTTDAVTRAVGSLLPVARVLGAVSLLAVGAIQLQQYFELYSEIPTVGTLFVLNFVGATVVGLGLLAPVERLSGRRGGAIVALLALAGIAQAATTFVFLLISERTPQRPRRAARGPAASAVSGSVRGANGARDQRARGRAARDDQDAHPRGDAQVARFTGDRP